MSVLSNRASNSLQNLGKLTPQAPKKKNRKKQFIDLYEEESEIEWLRNLDLGSEEISESLETKQPEVVLIQVSQLAEYEENLSADEEELTLGHLDEPIVNSIDSFINHKPATEASKRMSQSSRNGIRFYCENRKVIPVREVLDNPGIDPNQEYW